LARLQELFCLQIIVGDTGGAWFQSLHYLQDRAQVGLLLVAVFLVVQITHLQV
jgi:hypothetical protein